MTREIDSGLLVYRVPSDPEILLVRPGGPFWSKKKDSGTWSIPKNSAGPGDPLASARHQFTHETALVVEGEFITLAPIEQKGGRLLQAYAVECDLDLKGFRSNDFALEWPPGSGRMEQFPEVERIEYFDLRAALRKVVTVTGIGNAKFVYLAGVGAEDENGPRGNVRHHGNFLEQCRYAYDKIKRVLAHHGAGLRDVVKVTTYITDLRHRLTMGKCIGETWGDVTFPTHTLLGIGALAFPEMIIEVDVTAIVAAK